MSFLTPALTAGALMIAAPIILHLVMRREPQPLVFPALRFVRNRRSTNQTRLKLRHWILLALRCLAIAALAFALARPVLQGSGLQGGETGVVSAAVVIDNSPRMLYREQNETRLEAAQQLADWLIDQLPGDSRVGVLATGGTRGKRLADRDAARLRASRLAVSYRERPLEDAIGDAVELLAEREGDRHELYVFTDLAAAQWGEATRQAIAAHLDRLEGAKLLVVDVGARQASNRGLGRVNVGESIMAAGRPLEVAVEVFSTAASEQPIVAELWLDSGGKPTKRAETIINAAAGADATARFTIASLDEAVHQGSVRLASADALEADNERYFTVEVETPRPVLLVGADRTASLFVDQALAPLGGADGQPTEYETERIDFAQLPTVGLRDYRSVWLLDPPAIEDRVWRRLDDYARGGGSLAIALGRRAKPANLNRATPQALLPGKLKWKSRDATYLRPARYDHPALRQLADFAAAIPWSEFPVFQYWAFESLSADSLVVAPLANRDPAIIERPAGEGRVVTIVTPLSDPANNGPWNLLPTGQDPWPFLAVTKNLADYLSGATDRRLNYQAGEPAIVPAPPGAAAGGYVLRLPSGEAIRNSQPGLTEIVIGTTESPGNYRVQAGGGRNSAGGGGARLDAGFSANAAADIGRLKRIDFDKIAESLGKDRVSLARGQSELARGVDIGRVGRELYPWLIAVVALVLGAEHLMSNRFYGER
ncbi:MAG: BatA domain-containing protein [Planctomycetota bacterium]